MNSERERTTAGLAKSFSHVKTGEEKKRERLVILGMLIDIHELSSLASIFKMTGLSSTVSSKLESAIVKEHRRASLCCINLLSKHMIRYWSFVKGCRLDRILSSQRPMLPGITSISRFFLLPFFRERDLKQEQTTAGCLKIRHVSFELCTLTLGYSVSKGGITKNTIEGLSISKYVPLS